MSDSRFAGVARGRALPGARQIAQHIWGDEYRWRSVFQLPRDEYGLVILAGRVTGFTGWIDHALAVNATTGRKRRRKPAATPAV